MSSTTWRLLSLALLLTYLLTLSYRTFIISLNPHFFRDIDFHCYKQFGEIFLQEGKFSERVSRQEVSSETIQSSAAFTPAPFSLRNSSTWRLPPHHTQHSLVGPSRPSSLISTLLTLFIQKPVSAAYGYITAKHAAPLSSSIDSFLSLVQQQHVTLNYEYFLCDYGPMYYPATFILVYALLLSLSNFSPIRMQQFHAIGHYVNSLGAVLLFWEFYAPVMQVFQILCSFASQSIYMSGISAISNDLWSASLTILMLISIKYRHYVASSVLFSLGVGFKMNALLYGPALMVVYLVEMRLSLIKVVSHFFLIGMVQLALSAPFMLSNFSSYVHIAYNFSRHFDHIENIKWTFLGDSWRHEALFYKFLMMNTVVGMGLFLWCQYWWMAHLRRQASEARSQERKRAATKELQKARLFTMLGAHFVAFVFVRGLHIQFSLWVYFSLPFLIQCVFLDSSTDTLMPNGSTTGDSATTRSAKTSSSALFLLLKNAFTFLLITSFMLLYDFCISHPRRVLHVRAFPPMMQALMAGDFGSFISHLTGEDESLFGKLGTYIPYAELVQDKTLMQNTYYNLVGHFYLEGFDWTTIPGGFILFLLECVMLVFLFRHVKRNYAAARDASSSSNKMKVE
uniref:Uncharacterized protein n=1 Tax=Percolomonas cosmopolitus TaxID=63605 RepID=A0A7S1KNU7_9EUKA